MCVCPTLRTGMMPRNRSSMAAKMAAVVSSSWVTRGMWIFSMSSGLLDLDVEMPGDDLVGGVGARNLHVLVDAEVGAVDGEGALHEVADDHVPRHVAPLVEGAPQPGLQLPRPGIGRSAG